MKRLLMTRTVRVWSRSRALLVGGVVALFLAASFVGAGTGAAAPALANDPTGALAGIWNRLNPQQSQANPAPEHERLACNRRADIDGGAWLCRYHKIPEPALNFAWNNTTGRLYTGSCEERCCSLRAMERLPRNGNLPPGKLRGSSSNTDPPRAMATA